MGQYAIVMASDLARHGRWDAKFHIAAQRVALRAAEIEAGESAAEIEAHLRDIDMRSLAALKPLHRGTRPFTRAAAEQAVKEYPFIALALVEETLYDVIQEKKVSNTKASRTHKRLSQLDWRRSLQIVADHVVPVE